MSYSMPSSHTRAWHRAMALQSDVYYDYSAEAGGREGAGTRGLVGSSKAPTLPGNSLAPNCTAHRSLLCWGPHSSCPPSLPCLTASRVRQTWV